jgi:hypothetical protein
MGGGATPIMGQIWGTTVASEPHHYVRGSTPLVAPSVSLGQREHGLQDHSRQFWPLAMHAGAGTLCEPKLRGGQKGECGGSASPSRERAEIVVEDTKSCARPHDTRVHACQTIWGGRGGLFTHTEKSSQAHSLESASQTQCARAQADGGEDHPPPSDGRIRRRGTDEV